MYRILTYLLVSVFVVLGSSAAISSAQEPDDLGKAVVRGGYVNPQQYAFPKHLEQQRDALKTMRSMSQKDLDELANDFRHAVGRGSYIQQDVWANLAPKNGFTASPWDIAFNNYEHMINQTLARGELGNFNTEQFAVHEHFLNAYNRAVVDLAAGIISQAAAATVPAQSNIFTGDLFARSAEQASIMKEQ